MVADIQNAMLELDRQEYTTISFGVRRQSEATTAPSPHKSVTIQSGVALRLPPRSKIVQSYQR
jgi:hypothetical protein